MTYGPEISRDHPQLGWDDECPKWLDSKTLIEFAAGGITDLRYYAYQITEWSKLEAFSLPSDHWAYQTVDWSKPLRAINCKTGVWEDVELMDGVLQPDDEGEYRLEHPLDGWVYYLKSGYHRGEDCPYLIRNRPLEAPATVTPELDPDRVRRVCELVLNDPQHNELNAVTFDAVDALYRDLGGEKPDPLLIEARKIAAHTRRHGRKGAVHEQCGIAAKIEAGEWDEHQLVVSSYEALKRGMELAREASDA